MPKRLGEGWGLKRIGVVPWVRWRQVWPVVACGAALLAALSAVHPVAELGMIDDWSYAWSARRMAEIGHVVYNGGSTAMLGWQLYWGGLFVKLFGFSFFALRCSMLVISLATVALMQRLLVRFSIGEGNAMFGALTIALSPLFFPLSVSFMSDIPGFLAALACLYGCVRSSDARTDGRAVLWLVFAAISNLGLGTVRQIAWLGLLVMLPSTIWLLRKRRGVMLWGTALWIAGSAGIFAFLRWFERQPYVLVEKLIFAPKHGIGFALGTGISIVAGCCLLTCILALPAALALALCTPLRMFRSRRLAWVCTGLLVLGALCQPWARGGALLGSVISNHGFMDIRQLLGQGPLFLTLKMRLGLLAAGIWGILAALAGLTEDLGGPSRGREVAMTLLGPYTVAYLLLIITREAVYDRYLLPLLFVFVVVLMRLGQSRFGNRLPASSWVALALVGAFSVAGTHDSFAVARARIAAAQELQEAGVARVEIRGGFEYDAWTQLEREGFVDDYRITRPAGAYRPHAPGILPRECRYNFEELSPAVQGRFGLALAGWPHCFRESTFASVPYRTWMPWREQRIFILDLRPRGQVVTAEP